ncbi:MAG: NAD(P)H-dependent glycerol-3-phosphate dehydrogenase [Burkholderiales bacterium]
MKIAVLGAGAWGTAIAIHLAARHTVALWARDAAQTAAMAAARENARYLTGFRLPDGLEVTADFAHAVADAKLVLVATTTAGFRETLARLRDGGLRTPARISVIWLCKGLERQSGKLSHQIALETLGANVPVGVLSGPSFAQEVAQGLPTALTLAAQDMAFARDAALAIHGAALRVYSSDDVVGVEIAGAVKNVIAIAAGISDGLQLGHNARAALVTRGLAEIRRCGLALGAKGETFMGLAGLGDLVLTATSDLSRNRRVGLALAKGTKLADALGGLGHVAEGVYTAREVDRRAGELKIEMPITRVVRRVLDGELGPKEALAELLSREPKAE